ncbi:MAG: tetratricopeptide repeat protein [Elusimicrobiales bacterium]
MKIIFLALLLLAPVVARSGPASAQLSEDEAAFQNLADIYRASSDRSAVVDSFDKFIAKYPKSLRAVDARFMQGEAYMSKGLGLLRQEKLSKISSDARVLAGANPLAIAELNNAAAAYLKVIEDYKKSGLEASAQYRIGEAYYNMGYWERAIKEFGRVEDKYPGSYIVPVSLLGVVYANIAAGRFQTAQSMLFHLEETYLPYARDPSVIFAKAVIEMNRKNYVAAQKMFAQLDTVQARFFLGKSYLYEGKTYMAAGVFEKLLKDYPQSDYREEAEFLTADSFFYAKDFDGAIAKYQGFLKKYPASKLKSAAVFRIGASQFNKKDYPSARSNFQSIIDRSPQDFFAPYAQFFIAESYLENNQTRDALFAYTKITVNYAGSSVAPASQYKLAWCQYLLNDYLQAVHALENFLVLYPGHALAKNAWYLSGNVYLALKKNQEALRAFQSAVDLSPSSETAEQSLFMILRTEYARGNYNNILTSYQFIFKHLPPVGSKWRALSLLYVAEAYMALNLTDDARNIYNTVTRIYPNDVSSIYAQEGLVWCNALAGDAEAAVKAGDKLKTMRAAFPDLPKAEGVESLATADSYFNQKEFEKAYQLYDKFAAENAASSYAAGALYRAGLALYRLRYYTQAVEQWVKLSKNYPSAPETELADFQTADTYFRAQKYDDSIAAYNAIIARYPKSRQLPLAYLRVAQVYYNLKQDAQAVEQARTVVADFPDAPEAYDAFDLAEVVFDRAPAMDFKAYFLGLSALGPGTKSSGEALFRLGRRLFEKKDYPGAVEYLKKFCVEYIDHSSVKDAQFYLGEAYFQTGDMENAAGVFERFAANYPEAKEHPLALFRLGNAYYNGKKYEPAAKAYSKLAELYPDNEYIKPALFNLALCYKNTGATDLAEETYRRYYELSGKSEEALSALWEIFNIQKIRGDLAGSLKTLSGIYGEAEGKEDALEALYQMGEISLENKQADEARDYWERLSLQKPSNSAWRLQGLVKLGEIYEGEKNYPEAARIYEDISKNAAAPEVAKAAAERAKALIRMTYPEKSGPAKKEEKPSAAAEEKPAAPEKALKRGGKTKTPVKVDDLPGLRGAGTEPGN